MAKQPPSRTPMRDVAAQVMRERPRGQRVNRVIGPGNLSPGAGKEARRTEESKYCGEIAGMAFTYRTHPNSKDATKESTVFVGKFLVKSANDTIQEVAEVYLPTAITSMVCAMCDSAKAQGGGGATFAFEIWAEPDNVTGRETATGYTYTAFNIMPEQANDPLKQLAIAAGMLAPDQAMIEAPSKEPEYDPETGEEITGQ